MAIRCLVVDAHPLFRQGLRRVLENDAGLEVVSEAQDAPEAIERARELRPNVVLMDIGLLSSFEAARQITREFPGRRVIFLTSYEEEEYLMQCSEAGASGYILKDAPAPNLLGAIHDVSAGRKYFSPQVLGKLVDDFRSRSASGMARGSSLTPREREVVKMLREGHTHMEIAERLGLHPKAIQRLVRKLWERLKP